MPLLRDVTPASDSAASLRWFFKVDVADAVVSALGRELGGGPQRLDAVAGDAGDLVGDGPELVVGDDVGREALIGAGPQDRGEFVDAVSRVSVSSGCSCCCSSSLSCSVIVVTPCVLDDVSAVTAAVAVDSLFDPEARLATLVADDVLSDHSHEARSR